VIDLDKLIADAVVAELDRRLGAAKTSPDQVTVDEYARRWSLSPSTVRHAIREKRLPVTRIGRAIRIATDARIAPRVDSATANARLRLFRGGSVR
jgi:excisionase family DNA binding protein